MTNQRRIIINPADLAAMPEGTVIRESDTNPRRWVFEKGAEGDWMLAVSAGDTHHAEPSVPATVIFFPETTPGVIATEEARCALPLGTVVRSDEGTIACRFDDRYGVVFGDDRPFTQTSALELLDAMIDPTTAENHEKGFL